MYMVAAAAPQQGCTCAGMPTQHSLRTLCTYRRSVEGRPARLVEGCCTCVKVHGGQAKIDELHAAIDIKHDIVDAQVAVDDVVRVAVRESTCELGNANRTVLLGEAPLLEMVRSV